MAQKRTSQKNTKQHLEDDVVYEDVAIPTDKIKKLRTELTECKRERQEYLTGWQRAKADAINRERETGKGLSLAVTRGKESIITELLLVLDSFDMAMANREVWESVSSDWRMGIQHIHTQLKKVLETEGVEIVDEVGVVFDPQIHEPLEIRNVDSEIENDTVLEVLQKGYRTKEYTLRPAKVIIGAYNT